MNKNVTSMRHYALITAFVFAALGYIKSGVQQKQKP
jgi:hypothetical protein